VLAIRGEHFWLSLGSKKNLASTSSEVGEVKDLRGHLARLLADSLQRYCSIWEPKLEKLEFLGSSCCIGVNERERDKREEWIL
jgi:hypothetical protein